MTKIATTMFWYFSPKHQSLLHFLRSKLTFDVLSVFLLAVSPGTSSSSHKPKMYKHNGSTGNSELSVDVRTKVGCLSVWPCNELMACLGCTPTFALDSWDRFQSSCSKRCRKSRDRKQTDSESGSSLHREDLLTEQHYHLNPVHQLSYWGNAGCDSSPGLSMCNLNCPLWPSCVIFSTDYGFCFSQLKCSF